MIKQFLIELEGKQIPVILSKDQLSIHGKPTRVSLTELRPNVYSLLLNDHSHLIHVENGSAPSLTINGQTIQSRVVSERSELILRYGQQSGIQETATELRAPMPGLIMSVKVHEGDQVVEGQGLVVLEAMKMENELQSPCTGLIKHIHVLENDAVGMDTLLIEFEL